MLLYRTFDGGMTSIAAVDSVKVRNQQYSLDERRTVVIGDLRYLLPILQWSVADSGTSIMTGVRKCGPESKDSGSFRASREEFSCKENAVKRLTENRPQAERLLCRNAWFHCGRQWNGGKYERII